MPRGFKTFDDFQARCCFVDDTGARCDQPPVAGNGGGHSSTCGVHSNAPELADMPTSGFEAPEPQ